MNEKREAYIRVAVAMSKAGAENLRLTKSHSDYFLRGIIDWAEDGGKANLSHKRAPLTYRYSVKAGSMKYEKTAYEDRNRRDADKEKKLHAEHVIPNIVVFNKFVEMVESGSSEQELSEFLDENCEIIVITKAEAALLDSVLGLRKEMPDGWEWGDDRYARLSVAGIKIEQ